MQRTYWHAPAASLLATAALAILLATTGVYERLLAIYAPLSVGTNALVNLAAMRMRAKYPNLERPYRMPALIALSINIALAAGFIAQDFTNAGYLQLQFATGIQQTPGSTLHSIQPPSKSH